MDLEDYTGSTLWDLSETRVFRQDWYRLIPFDRGWFENLVSLGVELSTLTRIDSSAQEGDNVRLLCQPFRGYHLHNQVPNTVFGFCLETYFSKEDLVTLLQLLVCLFRFHKKGKMSSMFKAKGWGLWSNPEWEQIYWKIAKSLQISTR